MTITNSSRPGCTPVEILLARVSLIFCELLSSHLLTVRFWFDIYPFAMNILMYHLFLCDLLRSRVQFGSTTTQTNNSRFNIRREFLVPTVLMSTYFFLYLIPIAIIRFYTWKGSSEFDKRLNSPLYGYILLLCDAFFGETRELLAVFEARSASVRYVCAVLCCCYVTK